MSIIENPGKVTPTELGRADVIPTYQRPRYNTAVTAVLMLFSGVIAGWFLRKELVETMMYILDRTDWLAVALVAIIVIFLSLVVLGIRTGNLQAKSRQMNE